MPCLNALAIRQAKPQKRPYKLFDERGLFLLISPSGSKLWRFKYRYSGKEKQISFGRFPEVTLAQAREARASARRELSQGTDPSRARQARREAEESEPPNWLLLKKSSEVIHSSTPTIRILRKEFLHAPLFMMYMENSLGAAEV